jgi:regulator of cell morphogenesis and NO signaling
MTTIDTHASVGRLVVDRPARSRVFERFGIDYCCGGKMPLDLACERRGIDVDAVLRALDDCDGSGVGSEHGDWSRRPTGELIDHILEAHHAYLRRELPRLMTLAGRVAEAHGARHPEMVEVLEVLGGLEEELSSHMIKEERVLFPMLRRWEQGELSPAELSFLAGPISVMEAEHEGAAAALEKLRKLTGGYAPPEDACNTFRALLDGLAELEADLHRHVHEENNILFPRALSSPAS